jgi:hypothetical protein
MSQLITKALDSKQENKTTMDQVNQIINSLSALTNESLNQEMKEVVVFQKRMIKCCGYDFNFLLKNDIPSDKGSERAMQISM